MKAKITGTVINGALIILSERIDMPDNSVVRVSIEPVEDWRQRFQAGLKAWKQLSESHPVHGGGRRVTRDERHERH